MPTKLDVANCNIKMAVAICDRLSRNSLFSRQITKHTFVFFRCAGGCLVQHL